MLQGMSCHHCGKVLFDPETRVCRWRVAKIEFVPNGSQGPEPVFMAKCPRCKTHSRMNMGDMVALAQRQWEAALR